MELDVDNEVTLRRVWCAADAGLVINPDGARNQLEGGIVHAASMTLKEQVTFGGDGISSLDWSSYPIMKFSEVPEIDTVIIDNPDHANARHGRMHVRADGRGDRQRGLSRAGRAGAGDAVDAGTDRGGDAGRLGPSAHQ